jgi:hypothetical protein
MPFAFSAPMTATAAVTVGEMNLTASHGR